MSLANNDYNWRLVAATDIAENQAVTVDGAGKAAVAAAATAVGICPQTIKAGERCPVIRGGKLGGLVGFTAGAKLRVQGTGLLSTVGATTVVAIVCSEDVATAVILSGNLDGGIT